MLTQTSVANYNVSKKSLQNQLKDGRAPVAQLMAELAELQKLIESTSEDVMDLSSRNIIIYSFFGFGKYTTFKESQEEDCLNKILSFCTEVLELQDARDNIKIDRAKRMGSYTAGKKRRLVVKFNYHQANMQ